MIHTRRVTEIAGSNAHEGSIHFDWKKSAWLGTMILGGTIGLVFHSSWSAFLLFTLSTSLTLCIGHSVGLHRLLIHRSFRTHPYLEALLVYFGVLVGMGGPFSMIWLHDKRDWGQRHQSCHSYLYHQNGFFKDAWQQLFCSFHFTKPPRFEIESETGRNRFYRFLEASFHWQQIPWVLLFFAIGGHSWVLWGICLRISVSLIGHWMVGYFTHQEGPTNWKVPHMNIPGANLPGIGFLSMGEGYHNNHHAFPESARLGMKKWEWDPGWWFICNLKRVGLAWDINETS